ncbi:tetratricopeptide repeat protein, partial [Marichromatium gracile]
MTDPRDVQPEDLEPASPPAEAATPTGSDDGPPPEPEALAEPSPGAAPPSADATSIDPEAESLAPRHAWRTWLRSGWGLLLSFIAVVSSFIAVSSGVVTLVAYFEPKHDESLVTTPRLRTQLEASVEATYQRDKDAAEAIVGDWQARQRQLEAAEAQRDAQLARIDALAEEFQRIASGADADSVAKALTRILDEEGAPAALDYIETQRGDIIAHFLRDRAANRAKLKPLLASAGLYATEGEVEHARGLYAQVVGLAPDWPEALDTHRGFLIDQADLAVIRGDLDAAERDFTLARQRVDALIALQPEEPRWQHLLVLGLDRTGSLKVARGDLDGAQQDYEGALTISERLAESDPSHAGWQRDRSVSLDRVGDIKAAQGDLAGALAAYEESQEIRVRLAESDPSNAGWQRDRSVSLDRVGDIKAAQGDLAGALAAYEESLDIAERLAKSDPSHAGWQRDRSVSLDRVGDIKAAQGDLAG